MKNCTECKNHDESNPNCAHSVFMGYLDKNMSQAELDLITALLDCGSHNDIIFRACHSPLKSALITELTDVEYKETAKLNWVATCPNKKCGYFKEGKQYNPTTDPCIECQTDEPLHS